MMRVVAGRLILSVDDRGARYSVRVDPILQRAVLSASDGGVGSVAGSAVAVSGDTVAVGAQGQNSSHGAVYVFVKRASGWANVTQTAELTAPGSTDLGDAVAIDGNTIVAGAVQPDCLNGAGVLDVFTKPAGGWVNATPAATLTDGATDDLGDSVAIAGPTIVAGAPGRSGQRRGEGLRRAVRLADHVDPHRDADRERPRPHEHGLRR
jgi:FG-GAP repeat